jgi:catechol 2,3-dioxygenase-like lactoylglutathione lyase family enzyme
MLAKTPLTDFLTVTEVNQARAFYRDKLGLPLLHEDSFALVFQAHGVQIRISIFPDFHPQPFTVLGWQVENVASMSLKLQQAGILFERFRGLTQDEQYLRLAPSGYLIGWFRDPFGNLLSVSQPPATHAVNPSS